MNIEITIRRASISDCDAIAAIWAQGVGSGLHKIPEHKVLEHFQCLLRDSASEYGFWIAGDHSGRVLGWQSLLPLSMTLFDQGISAESSTYTIRRSGVPELGFRLFQHAAEHASKSSIAYIFGFVDPKNHAVKSLMKRFPFKLIGLIPASSKHVHCLATELYVYTLT